MPIQWLPYQGPAEFTDSDGESWVTLNTDGNVLLVGCRLCNNAKYSNAWANGEVTMSRLHNFRLHQHAILSAESQSPVLTPREGT